MNEGIVETQDLASRCGRVLAGAEPLASLEAYGSERLACWRALLAPAEARAADPWIAANASGIIEALPVAAGEAEQLLA